MSTEQTQTDNINTDKLTIDELFNRSKKYQGSEQFCRFFNFIARFKHYSQFNIMLVYVQDASVTFFGGAKFLLSGKKEVKLTNHN